MAPYQRVARRLHANTRVLDLDPDIFFCMFEKLVDSRGWSDGEQTLFLQRLSISLCCLNVNVR